MPDDHSITFFTQWLDKSLCVSGARFEDKSFTLDQAQERKYEMLCERLILESHHKILEIGPGFGGFAIYAARHHNVRVTLLTDNMRQKTFLEHRIAEEGLANLIDIQMLHIKDMPQRYDRIVMVEHLERAGNLNWSGFFEAAYRCLVPGGRAEVQCVVRGPAFNPHYAEAHDFVVATSDRPVRLTDVATLKRAITEAGLLDLGHVSFAVDYYQTLKIWQENFLRNWPQIQLLGYDDEYRRLWLLSMNYCATAFKNGYLNVIQKSVAKPFESAA